MPATPGHFLVQPASEHCKAHCYMAMAGSSVCHCPTRKMARRKTWPVGSDEVTDALPQQQLK